MKCQVCGVESEGTWKACPRCGREGTAGPAPAGPPGSLGPAMANGSDEVRNSKGPAGRPSGSDAVVSKPASQIVEGTGG